MDQPIPPPEDAEHQDVEPGVFDPELTRRETLRGEHAGDQYMRVAQPYSHLFRRVAPGYLQATGEVMQPLSPLARTWQSVKNTLIGRPLATQREIHERLTKIKALAVFGSDAISSCAYATEETLLVLVVAGNGALNISFFTALAIALLLSMVAFSYRQTVYAYPHGGGSYNVSRENLGQTAGLVAAAALLIDYVLTVSVSIAAGAANVTSALVAAGLGPQVDALQATLPHFLNVDVLLSLFFIGLITLGNLRGIRESGSIFAIPTYLFIFSLGAMLLVGLYKAATGTLSPAEPPPVLKAAEPVTLWLILRAFSAGAVAMSGVEAISNGVPVFKPYESKNAATTLTVMATLLGVFFVGISFFATHLGLVPSADETIISQIARSVLGVNAFYFVFQIATMGILVIAANTAFADFPRLSSVLARDDFMPHQFANRGDRLAFSTGILALGGIAALLLVIFAGDVSNLIHLYAVGVFLAFSMSDSGMVVHWWKTRGPRWKTSIMINGVDAVLTSSILIIVAVTKFALGAWIIVIAIPAVVLVFRMIHRHYSHVDRQLKINTVEMPSSPNLIVLVLVPSLNYATQRALGFAHAIAKSVTAITVSFDRASAEKLHAALLKYDPEIQHVILEDPYRSFYPAFLNYVQALHDSDPEAFVTVVIPEFIVRHWWERFLHNRVASRLDQLFKNLPNVAVVNVPFQIHV